MLNKTQQTKKTEMLRQTYNRRSSFELAEGYLRYEALRKLNPARYADLVSKSLAGAITFDEQVDKLVLENTK